MTVAADFLARLSRALAERGFIRLDDSLFQLGLAGGNLGKLAFTRPADLQEVLYFQALYYLDYPILTELLSDYVTFERAAEQRPPAEGPVVEGRGIFGGNLHHLLRGRYEIDPGEKPASPELAQALVDEIVAGVDEVVIPLFNRLQSPAAFLSEFEAGALPPVLMPTFRSHVLLLCAVGRTRDALLLIERSAADAKPGDAWRKLQCDHLESWIGSSQRFALRK